MQKYCIALQLIQTKVKINLWQNHFDLYNFIIFLQFNFLVFIWSKSYFVTLNKYLDYTVCSKLKVVPLDIGFPTNFRNKFFFCKTFAKKGDHGLLQLSNLTLFTAFISQIKDLLKFISGQLQSNALSFNDVFCSLWFRFFTLNYLYVKNYQ